MCCKAQQATVAFEQHVVHIPEVERVKDSTSLDICVAQQCKQSKLKAAEGQFTIAKSRL
jgi:hypothetical protein